MPRTGTPSLDGRRAPGVHRLHVIYEFIIECVFEGRAEANAQSLEEVRRIAMDSQSLKHFVDPKDVAALAVFLASDAAKSISGQVIPIDCDIQRS